MIDILLALLLGLTITCLVAGCAYIIRDLYLMLYHERRK